MITTITKPRLTSLAPQFLVDDLARSNAYYEKLGFTFGEAWEGFTRLGYLGGLFADAADLMIKASNPAGRRATTLTVEQFGRCSRRNRNLNETSSTGKFQVTGVTRLRFKSNGRRFVARKRYSLPLPNAAL